MTECTFTPEIHKAPLTYEPIRPLYIVGIELENGIKHSINIYEGQSVEQAVNDFSRSKSKFNP